MAEVSRVLFVSICIASVGLIVSHKLARIHTTDKFNKFDVANTLPIRGILALLIICDHIGFEFFDTPMSLFVLFGPLVVSLFFFFSGYGLMTSYMRKGPDYLKGFFVKRFGKLVPQFVLLSIICGIFIWNAPYIYIYEMLIYPFRIPGLFTQSCCFIHASI